MMRTKEDAEGGSRLVSNDEHESDSHTAGTHRDEGGRCGVIKGLRELDGCKLERSVCCLPVAKSGDERKS